MRLQVSGQFFVQSPRGKRSKTPKIRLEGSFARHKNTWVPLVGERIGEMHNDCTVMHLLLIATVLICPENIYQNLFFTSYMAWIASRSWLIKSSTWQVSEGRVKNGFGGRHFTPILSISQTAEAIQESACCLWESPMLPCFKASVVPTSISVSSNLIESSAAMNNLRSVISLQFFVFSKGKCLAVYRDAKAGW